MEKKLIESAILMATFIAFWSTHKLGVTGDLICAIGTGYYFMKGLGTAYGMGK